MQRAHADLRSAQHAMAADPPPTPEQSLAALDVAGRFYHFVLDRLPPETHTTP